MENVAMVLFEVESEAYQCFSELKRDAVNPMYTISQIGLVKKENGRILSCEGFDTGVDTADDMAKGGLIGGLIGVLGGPIGVLMCGSMGALIGSAIDTDDAVRNISMLEKVSEKLGDGGAALVALIQESDESVFDNRISKFKTEILRWDAAVIADEVEKAAELEEEMRRTAKESLRSRKKEDRRQELEQKRAKIQAEIETFKARFKKS